MPKYKVQLQQYVEEVAEIEVEADDIEAAVEIAQEMHRKGEIEDWSDGDDVVAGAAAKIDEGVYAASGNGEEWERG